MKKGVKRNPTYWAKTDGMELEVNYEDFYTLKSVYLKYSTQPGMTPNRIIQLPKHIGIIGQLIDAVLQEIANDDQQDLTTT